MRRIKSFKEFLESDSKDFRKIIKSKKKKKTVIYQHPVSVGGGVTYFGTGGVEASG